MPATAFIPDYAIPPGATLRETLLAQGVTQSAAARTLGLTAHQFRALLSGRRELTADTASRLDALTGIPTQEVRPDKLYGSHEKVSLVVLAIHISCFL